MKRRDHGRALPNTTAGEAIGAGIAMVLGILVLAFVGFIIASSVAPAQAQDRPHHSNPSLLEWIPKECCVTNDCCWQISGDEVRPLPGDQWEIKSTGQVVRRRGWSPDGKYYRCACDQDKDTGNWVRHQGANTRCLFVPDMGS